MGTVTIDTTPFDDGDSAIGTRIVTELQRITTQINGNIDANNLATNAVTAAKINANAVTPAKLATDVAVVPTGAVLPYGAAVAPTNYLLCDGSAVSRSTYATLFGVIAELFGAGDGVTTFNLPDMGSNYLAGYDATNTKYDAIGETGGTVGWNVIAANEAFQVDGGTTYGAPAWNWDENQVETIPPYVTFQFIIKT